MGELSIRSLFFVSTFVPAMGVLLITGTLALVAHLKLRLPRSSVHSPALAEPPLPRV